ncbi:hypothetical protein D3C85_1231800 [compost metagenome]
MQFGSQLHARGTGTDNRHADGFVGLIAGMGAQVVVEQLLVETLGLLAGVEEQAVLRRAQGAEVVGVGTHGNDQGVVAQGARRQQLAALVVEGGGQLNLFAFTVQAAHAPQLEVEVVPLGLGHVVQLVFRGVQRAGGHFVQQGLPDVREVGVDQGDLGLLALAQAFTQAGRQFQAAGAAADNHNTVSHGDIS